MSKARYTENSVGKFYIIDMQFATFVLFNHSIFKHFIACDAMFTIYSVIQQLYKMLQMVAIALVNLLIAFADVSDFCECFPHLTMCVLAVFMCLIHFMNCFMMS